MPSFLVFTDQNGGIRDVLWSDPVYLVHGSLESLQELFTPASRSSLDEAYGSRAGEKQIWIAGLQLIETPDPMDLYVLRQEEHTLVFGLESSLCRDACKGDAFGEILARLLRIIQGLSEKVMVAGSDATKRQFEQIQMMNNELMNTRRSLQKANVQLAKLNAELNNRLVKDPLTGLISRYQYASEIQMMIEQNPGKLGLFCFIDLDDFKSVNDRYGHSVGDAYLVEFARRLHCLPLENTLALRIAGDEFGLFVYGLDSADEESLERIWQTVLTSTTGRPINVNGNSLPVSISLGMAVYGRDTEHVYEMIDLADFAMYQAKRAGKNRFRIFSRSEFDEHREKAGGLRD